ncbi:MULTISPECIES: CsbD family protein [Kocuria]|uniref:CsbD family protein n=1 Tax=Kocuria TaxID=57493 RepID=UPI0006604143|nr:MULTISPECIES: CsbD family protein [Kocuria]MCT1368066.1 CsbD family protein [Rothia sp. p3-SID1597]RUQ21666.1 CsbD family protein [Kocuria sp. HSID16901]
MGIEDKANNAFQDASGNAKEKVGEAVGNDDLKNEGKGDQLSAAVKDGAEKVKDAARNIGDKLKG